MALTRACATSVAAVQHEGDEAAGIMPVLGIAGSTLVTTEAAEGDEEVREEQVEDGEDDGSRATKEAAVYEIGLN